MWQSLGEHVSKMMDFGPDGLDSYLLHYQTGSGGPQPHIRRLAGALSPRVNLPEREADKSSYNADVYNGALPTRCVHVFMVRCLDTGILKCLLLRDLNSLLICISVGSPLKFNGEQFVSCLHLPFLIFFVPYLLPSKTAGTEEQQWKSQPCYVLSYLNVFHEVRSQLNRAQFFYIYVKRLGMFPFKVQLFQGCKSETEPINTKSVVQHVIQYQVLLAANYKADTKYCCCRATCLSGHIVDFVHTPLRSARPAYVTLGTAS
jgi:hypothetical protein